MNVTEFLSSTKVAPLSLDTVQDMFRCRQATYRGFAKLEAEKGFLKPTCSLATAMGQEMARILFMRFLEELTESSVSLDRTHRLEELIDALNYLWSIAIIDSAFPLSLLTHDLAEEWSRQFRSHTETTAYISDANLGYFLRQLGGSLETFRNRAWQHSPQSLYFDGYSKLQDTLLTITCDLTGHFGSWEEFYQLFIAKDKVLQFRLRSNY